MTGPLEFVRHVLEAEGAVVEADPRGSSIEALLTDRLREALELPELARFDDDGRGEERACGYGTALLSRFAELALGTGRAAAVRVDLPGGPAVPPDHLTGLNVSFEVARLRREPCWMLLGLARYRAAADDERLGLVERRVMVPEGVELPFASLAPGALPLVPLSRRVLEDAPLRGVVPSLIKALRRAVADELEDLRQAVARRRRRDGARLERYFDDMAADLRSRLRRRGASGALREKLESIPAELENRFAQLRAECKVHVEIELAGLLALLVPGLAAEIDVRRRKKMSTLIVRYDGLLRRWAGLRCSGCGRGTAAFALCDETAHVLCAECWESCGSGGHRPCFRCRGEPEREPAGIVPA